MTIEKTMQSFRAKLADIVNLNAAAGLLNWDQQTYMPPGGAEDRGNQLAVISRIAHEMTVADEMGKYIEELTPYAKTLDPDSDDARLIRVSARDYYKQVKVPGRWVGEYAQVTAVAQQVWIEARQESNFAKFRPHLEKIVALRREYASFFAPYDHVYDPLLDDFEPGLKTADVQSIFSSLRPQQVELIKAIRQRPQVDNSFLHQLFDETAQWDFGLEIITRFGFDWHHGRQDRAAHPFTSSFGLGDVRITTRVNPKYLNAYLFANMHECGHALYDQGVDPRYSQTPLATGASYAVHESQSRMWENLVGRSRDFWVYFYPQLQKRFPAQLGNVSLDAFYKGINQVSPSLIRVEADEATYNLHIMLRLELEIALMEGSLEVKDLPEAWNARMQDYLGVTPPNDAQGVMQDIHWSGGMIGYFPTYALGNLVAAQLWECILKDMPDLPEQIRMGEFSGLLKWLRQNVHQIGAKFEPQELVRKITGSGITPEPYMRYLKRKFGEIYGL